jgi:hypothetical protein
LIFATNIIITIVIRLVKRKEEKMKKQNPVVDSVSYCPVAFPMVSAVIGGVELSYPPVVPVSPAPPPLSPAPPVPSAAARGANTLDISCICSEAIMTPVMGVGPK